MTVSKRTLVMCMLIACLGFAANAIAQGPDASLPRTMRPVIRGRLAAVSSMKAEATEVASRILQTGGNAFDAVVGGQAALAVTDFALNGVGSDAVVLVYDARAKKVLSINAEPRAPKLATIESYEKNSGGKIPVSDGLLSGGLPGVVDAWYILLDRWGTMSFEQVLRPAIDLAENGFPLSEARARMIASSQKILKYPSTIKIYKPNGETPKAGEIFKNPDLARTLKELIEAERANKAKGRHEALKAARDRFYTGDIAREMAAFSEANGGLFRYEDFAEYTAKVETPVSIDYRGYQVYKNPSASQGPTELIALNLLEGYDLKALGHNSADFNGDTSYIAIVDQDRNMVSFEPSLHSVFGTGVVMGNTGVIFNCRGDYYSLVRGEANALEPGKRPRSTLQSTLVMKDRQPFMITGSPGGDDQVMITLQTLVNVIDFGMNVQQAIEAPRWTTHSFPSSPFPHTMVPGDMAVEERVPEATQKELIARGHKLRVAPPWSLASSAAIIIDVKTGVLSAGADPRVEAYAWAW